MSGTAYIDRVWEFRRTLGPLGSEVGVASHQAAQALLQGGTEAPELGIKPLRLVDLSASGMWESCPVQSY